MSKSASVPCMEGVDGQWRRPWVSQPVQVRLTSYMRHGQKQVLGMLIYVSMMVCITEAVRSYHIAGHQSVGVGDTEQGRAGQGLPGHVVSTGDEYSSADHGGKHGDMTGQADPSFF